MGKIFYNLIYKNFPIVDNQYSALFFIFLTTLFFLIGSNINVLGFGKALRRVFKFLISSNKNKIDRHRMVNECLKEEFLSDLHSVVIKTYTFDEHKNI